MLSIVNSSDSSDGARGMSLDTLCAQVVVNKAQTTNIENHDTQ